MKAVVILSKNAEKDLAKLPKNILIKFQLWEREIEINGYLSMQQTIKYRDHALKGDRNGQRSSYLNWSWRVIYILDQEEKIHIIEVIEVNHHEY